MKADNRFRILRRRSNRLGLRQEEIEGKGSHLNYATATAPPCVAQHLNQQVANKVLFYGS
jgi:hypothetical protein